MKFHTAILLILFVTNTRCDSDAAQSCSQFPCGEGKICVERARGPTCENNVFSSCRNVTCPSVGMRCVELHIPTRSLSVGQCFAQERADSYPTFDQFSCSSGVEICKQDAELPEVCIESFQNNSFLTVVCAGTGCSDEFEARCPGFLLCAESPEHLQDSFSSVCVAPTNFEFGNDSCDAFDKGCTSGFACHDFTFEGRHIGTDCGPSGTTFSASTCAELECPTLLECYQRTISGRGSLAQCAFTQTVDMISEEIESLLSAAMSVVSCYHYVIAVVIISCALY